jgi:hypothetical protein
MMHIGRGTRLIFYLLHCQTPCMRHKYKGFKENQLTVTEKMMEIDKQRKLKITLHVLTSKKYMNYSTNLYDI